MMSSLGSERFRPGIDRVYYTRAVYGQEEIEAVVSCLRRGWLGPGKLTERFENRIAKLFGKRYGLLVNSGSSANFVAMAIANLPQGSEIITQACTFPTTLSPIVAQGFTPVFVDSRVGTYNADLTKIETAIGPKTKAIFVSHALGNINDMRGLSQICQEHKLLLLEDSCDIVGGKFSGKPTGIWSDVTTTSFYAPHHMTTAGGGGMVMTKTAKLIAEAKVFRDWGRALPENEDQNLDERFRFRVGGVPYDGKFTYVKLGYNFKPIEIMAAFGLVQLKRLPRFNAIRARNFRRLFSFFRNYEEHFVLPEVHPEARVYWLAFPLTIRGSSPIERKKLLLYLEKRKIQTRLLFAGNILHHVAYRSIQHRVSGSLAGADTIMKKSFLIGCHHGMSEQMVDYLCQVFEEYLRKV